MREYSGFARVYETFMDNIPYDDWAAYIVRLMKENGVSFEGDKPIVAELGCGTGSITRRLRAAGCDMIGIDMSAEMLQMAREHEVDEDDSILYLMQDMREFELYGSVAAIVSICDSMNYLLEDEDLKEVFALVNNYLDPGGVFIFDMHTEHYYREVLGERTICENRDIGSFIWENYYDEEEHINEFDMTIYYCDSQPEEGEAELYQRCEEVHYQRAWKQEEVTEKLAKAGLDLVGVFTAMTKDPARPEDERIYYVARKKD